MGHRNDSGWIRDVQTPAQFKPDINYNLLLAVNGTNATLMLNNMNLFSYTFAPRIVDGLGVNLKEVTVQLTDRIVLSPFAAKRMAILLQNVIRDYESRYGELDIGIRRPPTPGAPIS